MSSSQVKFHRGINCKTAGLTDPSLTRRLCGSRNWRVGIGKKKLGPRGIPPEPTGNQRLAEKRSRSVLFSLVLGLILRLGLPRSLILLFFHLFLLVLEGLQFITRLLQEALVHFEFFLQVSLLVFRGFFQFLLFSGHSNCFVVGKNC